MFRKSSVFATAQKLLSGKNKVRFQTRNILIFDEILLQQKVESSVLQNLFLEELCSLVECNGILFSQVSLEKFTRTRQELRDVERSSCSHDSNGVPETHVEDIRVQELEQEKNLVTGYNYKLGLKF
jgi:hypothetical protein